MEFEAVYEAYFRDVYRYLRALGADRFLAEELTQQTFFRALEALDRYDARKDIRAWLFTIARNGYYSVLRRQGRLTEAEEAAQDPAPPLGEALADRETAMQVHRLLHQLPEPYKEVFSLRVLGELPFGAIGQLFGKSAGWARTTFYRAKVRIQEQMEE